MNALAQQSTALTSLVAHLVSHSGDPLVDLQAGLVYERGPTERETASRFGSEVGKLFPADDAASAQATPPRTSPSKDRGRAWGGLLPGVSRNGGYRNQKTLGLVQWILAHAIDAAAQGDIAGVKEILAWLAMAVEQANFDGGDWGVAYLISLIEEPPIQLFQERSVNVTATEGRSHH